MKGRSVADNVLLMQQLVISYHKNYLPARCAIKIDLMTAYDSVDWSFLFDTMASMEFTQRFIKWVKTSVATARFSMVTNGELQGYLKGREV